MNNEVTLEDVMSIAFLVPIAEPEIHPSDVRTQWGVHVNVIGLSGPGKTSRIRKAARAIGIDFHPIFCGTKQPEDFTGAWAQTPGGQYAITVEPVLAAVRRVIATGSGVLFLDELTTASARTQAAGLSLVDERLCGDHALPNKVRTCSAMNPPEYAAGGFAITAPLANRMMHYHYPVPSRDAWCQWLQGIQNPCITITNGEQYVINHWNQEWPGVVGSTIGVMHKFTDEHLHNQPKPDEEASSGAWPSHRTWYHAIRSITTIRCLRDLIPVDVRGVKDPAEQKQIKQNKIDELEKTFMKGFLGEAVAVDWFARSRDLHLPTPVEMLTQGWAVDTIRLDRTYAAFSGMSEFIKTLPNTADSAPYAAAAWGMVNQAIQAGLADVAVRHAGILAPNWGRKCAYQQVVSAASPVIRTLLDEGALNLAGV